LPSQELGRSFTTDRAPDGTIHSPSAYPQPAVMTAFALGGTPR
jgi:hypothetical protein